MQFNTEKPQRGRAQYNVCMYVTLVAQALAGLTKLSKKKNVVNAANIWTELAVDNILFRQQQIVVDNEGSPRTRRCRLSTVFFFYQQLNVIDNCKKVENIVCLAS